MQTWRSLTIVFALLLIVAFYFLRFFQQDAQAQPLRLIRAVATLTTSTPIADVEIQNLGREPIDVIQITTSCSCSIPEAVLPLCIPPGKSEKFVVRGDPPAYGVQTVELTVHTNDARQRHMKVPVTLRGEEMHPPYAVHHNDPHWQVLGRRDSVITKLRFETIEKVSDEPWLKAVRCSEQGAIIGTPAVVDRKSWTPEVEQRTYEMDFHFVATETPRPSIVTGELRLEVASPPSQPLPSFRFVLESRELLAIHPETLFFTLNAESRPELPEQRIRVWRRDGEPLKLALPSSSVDWLQIKDVSDGVHNDELEFLVQIRNASEIVERRSSTIHFEDENGATVDLPVLVRSE